MVSGIHVVGLTGGIAAGKSSVAGLLAGLGAPLVDADQLAREITRPGSAALAAIREAFGDGVIAQGGALDRAALGRIVFADPAARRRLEAITHPEIIAEGRRR
ncbi:MAG: dephospho-CoA kinase, partial [Acidobacteriota bacterium]